MKSVDSQSLSSTQVPSSSMAPLLNPGVAGIIVVGGRHRVASLRLVTSCKRWAITSDSVISLVSTTTASGGGAQRRYGTRRVQVVAATHVGEHARRSRRLVRRRRSGRCDDAPVPRPTRSGRPSRRRRAIRPCRCRVLRPRRCPGRRPAALQVDEPAADRGHGGHRGHRPGDRITADLRRNIFSAKEL